MPFISNSKSIFNNENLFMKVLKSNKALKAGIIDSELKYKFCLFAFYYDDPSELENE